MPGPLTKERVNKQASGKRTTEIIRFSMGDFANPLGVWPLVLPALDETRAITEASRSTVLSFNPDPF